MIHSEHLVTSDNEEVTFQKKNGVKFRIQMNITGGISIVKVYSIGGDDSIKIIPATGNRINVE